MDRLRVMDASVGGWMGCPMGARGLFWIFGLRFNDAKSSSPVKRNGEVARAFVLIISILIIPP